MRQVGAEGETHVYEFGITYSQVGKTPPAGGGQWPQATLVFGTAATLNEARENYFECMPAIRAFILDAVIRFKPLLGFDPYPDLQTFYRPRA